jgi:beta-N-acetylhexosaminidase
LIEGQTVRKAAAVVLIASSVALVAGRASPYPLASNCDPLTTRERAAQTVMSGVPGTGMSPSTKRLVARNAGSVILSSHNIETRDQLTRLIHDMRKRAPLRLLVAIDEEGGRVSRLGARGLVDHLPSARQLAKTYTADQVRRKAKRVGEQMRRLGLDWNLAPVLDVTGAPDNSVIGDRSFSKKTKRAAKYGKAFADGLSASGIMATGKHFPGHGRTSTDSHSSLPSVDTSKRQLRRRDLKPYFRARSTLDAVMTAHVRFTALDRRFPASLSRAATRLLRDEVDFDGLLMTDSLGMGAITNTWSVPSAAARAVRAGADIVLVTDWHVAKDVVERLVAHVRRGRISERRLDHAVQRILSAKGFSSRRISCLLS